MKKYLILLIFSLSVFNSIGAVNDYSKWSISIDGGINKFDGDVNQRLIDVIPSSVFKFTYGGQIEYTLTPTWGVSLDVFSIPVKAETGDWKFQTNILNTNINGIVNFNHLIFPYSKSKVAFFGYLGFGISRYEYNVLPIDNTKPVTDKIKPEYGIATTIPVAFAVEYNYSKHIDFGLKYRYIAFNKDNLEGVEHLNYKGVSNDYVAVGTVYLRYKFCKEKEHVRNVNLDEKYLSKRIGGLQDQISKLSNKINKINIKIDTTTIYNNTYNNTYVDNCYDDLSIYFDFDKYYLTDNSLITLRKVATKLKSDTTSIVEIRAYCDYMGNVPYNYDLSVKRANRTKEELINIWKISPDRIVATGLGRITDPAMKYVTSRRCDFFFYNK